MSPKTKYVLELTGPEMLALLEAVSYTSITYDRDSFLTEEHMDCLDTIFDVLAAVANEEDTL